MHNSIPSGSSSPNDCVADLVDEKGSHNDIYKYATMADIVVCCLNMNRETVNLPSYVNLFLPSIFMLPQIGVNQRVMFVCRLVS